MGTRRLSQRVGAVMVAVALSAGVFAATPARTLAVTCSGFGCDGTSPYTTGCSADAGTWGTFAMSYVGYHVGDVSVRYSYNCGTAWTLVKNLSGYTEYFATGVSRYSPFVDYDYKNGTCGSFCIDRIANNSTSYGYQVYIGRPASRPGYAPYSVQIKGYACASTLRSTCGVIGYGTSGGYMSLLVP